MKSLDANYYRSIRIIFLIAIVVGIWIYALLWILDWGFSRTSTSLISLQRDHVSEIRIFNAMSSQETLLVTLSRPKDNENIYEFVNAINKSELSHPVPRELILSHGLYLFISLNDGDKPIELVFHLHNDCRKTVYIGIVRKLGGVESTLTSYLGGARSERDLYEWLQRMNLSTYLGCN